MQNLLHFPEPALAPFNIEAQHPDNFLRSQLNLAPGVYCNAVRKVHAALVHPPCSVEQYLATLTR